MSLCRPCSSSLLCGVRCSATRPLLCEQRRFIRNLHQYPKVRYRSVIRARFRFSRKWFLFGGNNWELHRVVGHELEAQCNFGVYKRDSALHPLKLSTSRLDDLPPVHRFNALLSMISRRWAVRDSFRSYDKMKLALQAAECCEDLCRAKQVRCCDLPNEQQSMFLDALDSAVLLAERCVHSHPDAVAAIIRCAEIAVNAGVEATLRDKIIHRAKEAAEIMPSSYAFAQSSRDLELQPQRPLFG